MSNLDAAKLWSLNYRLVTTVITSVAPEVAALGLEVKELFLLAQVEEYPHPAALASVLCMPKPTVTVHVKRLVDGGFLHRDIDVSDLRRHRLTMTPTGRTALTRGLALLSKAFGARLEVLSPAEQEQLKTLLEKML